VRTLLRGSLVVLDKTAAIWVINAGYDIEIEGRCNRWTGNLAVCSVSVSDGCDTSDECPR
jgi:hypothetical protein